VVAVVVITQQMQIVQAKLVALEVEVLLILQLLVQAHQAKVITAVLDQTLRPTTALVVVVGVLALLALTHRLLLAVMAVQVQRPLSRALL
jgi:hypothetical protein